MPDPVLVQPIDDSLSAHLVGSYSSTPPLQNTNVLTCLSPGPGSSLGSRASSSARPVSVTPTSTSPGLETSTPPIPLSEGVSTELKYSSDISHWQLARAVKSMVEINQLLGSFTPMQDGISPKILTEDIDAEKTDDGSDDNDDYVIVM